MYSNSFLGNGARKMLYLNLAPCGTSVAGEIKILLETTSRLIVDQCLGNIK